MDTKFNVFSIFNTVGDYSRVTVSSPLFQAIAKNNPELPYTTSKDGKGRDIRIFTVMGLKIFTREEAVVNTDGVPETYLGGNGQAYPKKDYFLYMRTADATPIQTNKADETAQYALACD